MMDVNISQKDNKFTLEIVGRLDTTNALTFEENVKSLYEIENIDLTLDAANLTYISSSGLRCFIILLKKIKANAGKMVIINMKKDILEVFEMTGFSKLFEIK